MSTLSSHMVDDEQSLHNESRNLNYQCDVCGNSFTKKSNLTRHVRRVHGIDPLPRCFKYNCDNCHQVFNSISQLRHHQAKEHTRLRERRAKKVLSQHTETDLIQHLEAENFKEESSTRTAEVKKHECPLCKESFCRPDFPSHFEKEHKLTLQTETLEFDSFSDFMEWKGYMENETKSNYYKERTSKYGQMNYHYFICNRSGTYKAKGLGTRYAKGQASCKINAYCPSSIRVQERKDGNCLVTYQKVHVGHKLELNHMDLSAERPETATKITGNMSFDDVLGKIHSNSVQTGELKKLNFLTRKDLHNIKNSYLDHYQSNLPNHRDAFHWKKCSSERTNEHLILNPRENQDDFDLSSDFSMEDSEILKEENEESKSLQDREENLIMGFTEIVKYACTLEEYDLLEETLISLKPKLDALRQQSLSSMLPFVERTSMYRKIPSQSNIFASISKKQ